MKRISTLFCLGLVCLTMNAQTVNVMSYNVRLGIADDGDNSWEFRRDAAVEMLVQEAPDCFGVQEAFDFQRDYFLEKLPSYKAVGRGRNDGSDEGEHMCVFYNTDRFTLSDSGDFWLSETPDVPSKGWDAKYPRIATWVLLKDKKSGKSFYMVNTHLDHKGVQARKNSVDLIINKIASINPDSLPMVLTGDFNLRDTDSTILYFDGLMNNARLTARSTDHENSFNAWGNPEKGSVIDYIYYSGFKKCTRFRTVKGEWLGRTLVSDHNPIIATLKF